MIKIIFLVYYLCVIALYLVYFDVFSTKTFYWLKFLDTWPFYKLIKKVLEKEAGNNYLLLL